MTCFSLTTGKQVLTNKKIIKADDFATIIQAYEILEQGKLEIQELKDKEHKVIQELKEKAKIEGFEEGMTQFSVHILHLEEKIKKMLITMQSQILPLTLKATKKIIGQELRLHPEVIVDIVNQAIKNASHAELVKIYVSKEDFEIVEKKKEEIKGFLDRVKFFSIEERADVKKGDCLIETEKGILNATLENQFRALERAFENYKQGT